MFSICKYHHSHLDNLNEYIKLDKLLFTFDIDNTSIKTTFNDVTMQKENRSKFFYNNSNIHLETLRTNDYVYSIKLNLNENIEFSFRTNYFDDSVEIECPQTDMLSIHPKVTYDKKCTFLIDDNSVDAIIFVDSIYKQIVQTMTI